MVKKEVLEKHFQEVGYTVEDDEIFTKCMDICDIYDVSEEKFVEIWVSYIVSHDIDCGPTVDNLTSMERSEFKTKKKTANSVDKKDALRFVNPDIQTEEESHTKCDNILEIYGCDRPVATKHVKRVRSPAAEVQLQDLKIRAVDYEFSPASYTIKPNTPSRYSSATSRGTVLSNFGINVSSWEREHDYDVEVSKADPSVPVTALYMGYENKGMSSEIPTHTRIYEYLGERICRLWSQTDLNPTEYFRHVKTQSSINFRTYGRICWEVDKLGRKFVALEGVRKQDEHEESVMVELNFNGVQHYSLFPGQIIGVDGVNSTGDCLIAKELFAQAYAPKSDTPKLSKSLNIIIAAGPFTPSDNLNYQPLWDLMEYVAEQKPHILLLIGPFLEFNHSEIQNASIKDTFTELFEKIIVKVMQYVESKSVQVILVPSNQDAHHNPVFPTSQYAIDKRKIRDISSLHLVPDPCVLNMDGLTLGVTSVDTIKHLASQDITNTPGMDRMTRLANHLLSQSSFYPLYPPALEINVDINLCEKYSLFNNQPHILIVPSDMRHFCKTVNECLVLNPERLRKYTYARLRINPVVDGKWDLHNVSCEIAKI